MFTQTFSCESGINSSEEYKRLSLDVLGASDNCVGIIAGDVGNFMKKAGFTKANS
jgi:hypothetical protein